MSTNPDIPSEIELEHREEALQIFFYRLIHSTFEIQNVVLFLLDMTQEKQTKFLADLNTVIESSKEEVPVQVKYFAKYSQTYARKKTPSLEDFEEFECKQECKQSDK